LVQFQQGTQPCKASQNSIKNHPDSYRDTKSKIRSEITNHQLNQSQIINKVAKKKKKEIILENVLIEGVADKGFSIGRHENRVVFVKDAVPGDIVDVNVYRKQAKGLLRRLYERDASSLAG